MKNFKSLFFFTTLVSTLALSLQNATAALRTSSTAANANTQIQSQQELEMGGLLSPSEIIAGCDNGSSAIYQKCPSQCADLGTSKHNMLDCKKNNPIACDDEESAFEDAYNRAKDCWYSVSN